MLSQEHQAAIKASIQLKWTFVLQMLRWLEWCDKRLKMTNINLNFMSFWILGREPFPWMFDAVSWWKNENILE